MSKEELRLAILGIINESKANISILVENLDNNEILFSYNEEDKVVSASMIKVPILLCTLEFIQKGYFSFETMIKVPTATILDDTKVFEYGAIEYTLDELLVWMIINSDNTATNCLIDIITMDKINDFCRSIELQDTKIERKMLDFEAIKKGNNNYTSAKDMEIIYKALFDKTILNPELCEYAISVLKRQRSKQTAMRYIYDEVVVAHKTGNLDFLDHDAGIFYLDRVNYYLGAFVTKSTDKNYSKKCIGRISKLVYKYYLDN